LSGLAVARVETAFSLSFHIMFAVFGVGMPWLVLYTERRWLTTGDPVWYAITRSWARVMAVLFAIGAVSGTVLSLEFGLLWPAFTATYGGAIGLLFTLEAFAFFAEAIFMGLYLYGWKRLSARAHWLTLWPIAIAGTLSTMFIVMANAWMNHPVGLGLSRGRATARPWAVFTSSTSWTEVTHMLIAALMCTAGAVAAVYAVGMLRGRRDRYHRAALNVGTVTVLALAPIQMLAGDFAVRDVAATQPGKLAAMEAHYATSGHVPLTVGGFYDGRTHHLVGGVPIPDGLSLLLRFDPGAVVPGLDRVPADRQPMTAAVHLAFDTMVGLGTAILAIAAWGFWRWWRGGRRRSAPRVALTRPWLAACAFTGPAAIVAMLAGWEVTEGGRQPWIVYGRMLVADAATKSPGLGWALLATVLIYLGLALALILILRKLAGGAPPELIAPDDDRPSSSGPAGHESSADGRTRPDPGPGADTESEARTAPALGGAR
jgi:cytochrome d ubiquinol oxidase subunit I